MKHPCGGHFACAANASKQPGGQLLEEQPGAAKHAPDLRGDDTDLAASCCIPSCKDGTTFCKFLDVTEVLHWNAQNVAVKPLGEHEP